MSVPKSLTTGWPALPEKWPHVFELRGGQVIVLHPDLPHYVISEVAWYAADSKVKPVMIDHAGRALRVAYQRLREAEDPRVTAMRTALREIYRVAMDIDPFATDAGRRIVKIADDAMGTVNAIDRGRE